MASESSERDPTWGELETHSDLELREEFSEFAESFLRAQKKTHERFASLDIGRKIKPSQERFARLMGAVGTATKGHHEDQS